MSDEDLDRRNQEALENHDRVAEQGPPDEGDEIEPDLDWDNAEVIDPLQDPEAEEGE
jgi:hypothetical protein